MGLEIDGVMKKVTAEDGETSIKAGHIHCFFIHPDCPDYMTVLLSAMDPGMDYQLDRVFFENWYGYWHDAVLHDCGLDWIQTLCVSRERAQLHTDFSLPTLVNLTLVASDT